MGLTNWTPCFSSIVTISNGIPDPGIVVPPKWISKMSTCGYFSDHRPSQCSQGAGQHPTVRWQLCAEEVVRSLKKWGSGMAVILIPKVEGPEAMSTMSMKQVSQVSSAVIAVKSSEGDLDVSVDFA